MMRTMQTIVRLQKPFFQEGDETLLRPMRLEDVAEQTGYDISTISRVANSKYVETTFGTYPLKWFFTHKATQSNEGTDITARQIMAALRQHIEQEDKRQPLSDERLTQMLQANASGRRLQHCTAHHRQISRANGNPRGKDEKVSPSKHL
jgi:RNA polymerase sigma-54 factor